jgi:hypothetical protein
MSSAIAEVCCRIVRHTGPGSDPKYVLVGTKMFQRLIGELQSIQRRVGADGTEILCIMGVPVVMEAPREFCRNCGAAAEPDECSYCKSPSETIEVQE